MIAGNLVPKEIKSSEFGQRVNKCMIIVSECTTTVESGDVAQATIHGKCMWLRISWRFRGDEAERLDKPPRANSTTRASLSSTFKFDPDWKAEIQKYVNINKTNFTRIIWMSMFLQNENILYLQ